MKHVTLYLNLSQNSKFYGILVDFMDFILTICFLIFFNFVVVAKKIPQSLNIIMHIIIVI